MFRIFLTVAAAASLALAQPDSEAVKKDLLAIYQKLDAFASHNDNAAAEAYYTPDWTTSAPGQPSKTLKEVQAMEAKSGLNDAANTQEVSRTFKTLNVNGNEAQIEFEVKIDAQQKDTAGQFGEAGQVHKITASATVRDTWVQTPDGWRQRAHARLTPNKVLVDGKALPDTAPGKKKKG